MQQVNFSPADMRPTSAQPHHREAAPERGGEANGRFGDAMARATRQRQEHESSRPDRTEHDPAARGQKLADVPPHERTEAKAETTEAKAETPEASKSAGGLVHSVGKSSEPAPEASDAEGGASVDGLQPGQLHAWRLGPNLQVISDGQVQLQEGDLEAFANDQGIDWSAIVAPIDVAMSRTDASLAAPSGLGALSSDASPMDIMATLTRVGLGLERQQATGAQPTTTQLNPLMLGSGDAMVDATVDELGLLRPEAKLSNMDLSQALAQMKQQALAAGTLPKEAPVWRQSLDLHQAIPGAVPLLLAGAVKQASVSLVPDAADGAPVDAKGVSLPTSTSTPGQPLVATKDVLQQDALLLGRQQGATEELSQKMGEALAQRLQAQIQRGHWRMSLSLNPRDLGHIDVTLGMKGNDLQASFQAAHMATRELIQDSLPRLREVLVGAGIDVASLDVGGQQKRESGGNSTHSGSAQAQLAPVQDAGLEVAGLPARLKMSESALDIWA